MQSAPNELSQEERTKLADFLDSHPIGVLATVDPSGEPHASTIYFSVDSKDLSITFTTKRDTRKHESISHHNSVMLAVYDAESQTAAQVSGKALEATDLENVQKAYHGTLRAAKQTGEDNVPPIAKIAAGPYVAYVVKPDSVWMSEYGWGSSFANALASAQEPTSSGDPD